MKIAVVGVSPDAKTGYGTQTRGILEALSKKHEVYSIAQVGDAVVWGGTRVWRSPSGLEIPIYALTNPLMDAGGAARSLKEYYRMLGLDFVIGHWDLFPLNFLQLSELPFVDYVPVDGPMTRSWYDMGRMAQRIVSYCNYGTREFLKFAPPGQIAQIPHGLDTTVFRPLGEDRGKLRKKLPYSPDIPEDAFLLMHVGTNVTERKQLPLLFKALAKFSEVHKDAHLLLHTNPLPAGGAGYNLPSIARDLGIEDRVHYPQKNPILVGASDEEMVRAFNAANFYITVSEGEGWGVPLVEAMACGTPCIAGRNSSQTELVDGHGYLFDMVAEDTFVDYPMYTPYGSWFPVPDLQSLLGAMKMAHAFPDTHQGACRTFAERFDWSKVGPRWQALVEEVGEEIALFKSVKW